MSIFRNLPFFNERIYSGNAHLVSRQTEAAECFSPFQKDSPPVVCVTAPMWVSWFEGAESARRLLWPRPLSSLSMNTLTRQLWWRRDGAVSYSVKMNKTLSVISPKSVLSFRSNYHHPTVQYLFYKFMLFVKYLYCL